MYFLGQLISGLAIGSIYSLLGLGFTMIFACTRRINFAHGDLMALGGFLGLFFLSVFPSVPIAAFIVAPLMNGFITAGVERVFFRRLQEAQPLKIVIATIGLSIILKIIMKMIWGDRSHCLSPPDFGEDLFLFRSRNRAANRCHPIGRLVVNDPPSSFLSLYKIRPWPPCLLTGPLRRSIDGNPDRLEYQPYLLHIRNPRRDCRHVDRTRLFHLEYDGNQFGSEVLYRRSDRRTGECPRNHCRRPLSRGGRKLFVGIYLFQL